MNANRLIRMLLRQLTKNGMPKGTDPQSRVESPKADTTPEQRKRARALKKSARQARKGLRMARRFTRF